MKKLIISLVVALFLMGALNAYAVDTANISQRVIINTDGYTLATAVPTTVLRPGKDYILRFQVTPIVPGGDLGLSTEAVAAIFDSSTLGGATNQFCEGEIESNDADSVEERYTNPMGFKNGIVLTQGAQTVLLIEWEKRIP